MQHCAKQQHCTLFVGHLICHRGTNPTYVFDACLWGPITLIAGGETADDRWDFSQTVIAATGKPPNKPRRAAS